MVIAYHDDVANDFSCPPPLPSLSLSPLLSSPLLLSLQPLFLCPPHPHSRSHCHCHCHSLILPRADATPKWPFFFGKRETSQKEETVTARKGKADIGRGGRKKKKKSEDRPEQKTRRVCAIQRQREKVQMRGGRTKKGGGIMAERERKPHIPNVASFVFVFVAFFAHPTHSPYSLTHCPWIRAHLQQEPQPANPSQQKTTGEMKTRRTPGHIGTSPNRQ